MSTYRCVIYIANCKETWLIAKRPRLSSITYQMVMRLSYMLPADTTPTSIWWTVISAHAPPICPIVERRINFWLKELMHFQMKKHIRVNILSLVLAFGLLGCIKLLITPSPGRVRRKAEKRLSICTWLNLFRLPTSKKKRRREKHCPTARSSFVVD